MFFWTSVCSLIEIISNFGNKVRKNQKNTVFLLLLMILLLISGTRNLFDYNGDAHIYLAIYEAAPNLLNFNDYFNNNFLKFYEIGYVFINSFFKTLGVSYTGFVFLHNLFFLGAIYYSLRDYIKDYEIFLSFFIYKIYIYDMFVSLRQSITIAIFLFMIDFMRKKQWIRYLFLGCIAGLIHSGAYILLPVYLINFIKINKNNLKLFLFILVPGIFVNIFKINIISNFANILYKLPFVNIDKVANLTDSTGNGISLLHVVEYFVILIIIMFNWDVLIKNRKHEIDIFIKLLMILGLLLTYFSGAEILTRLKDYFLWAYPILLGYIFDSKKSNRGIFVIKYVFILYCYGCYFRYLINFCNGGFLNYSSWLIDKLIKQ